MYLYHFGMRELPFTITPNTSFYCGLQAHEEALQVLLTALKTGEGFIKVTGEVGTGKTLLCRKLLNEMPQHFVAVYIPNSFLNPQELRLAIAAELGITASSQPTLAPYQLIDAIHHRLLDVQRSGQTVVVIIDEAQALPDASLEALRLLSNLETEQAKLVQLVLFGQPELDQRLRGEGLRQLRQRIGFSYRLRTMTLHETGQYIHHRLEVAGYRGDTLFPHSVLKQLHRASRGVPRLLNILCHKCLMLAYGKGHLRISRWAVRYAISDTADAKPNSTWLRWFLPSAVATVAMLASALLYVSEGVL